MNSSVPLFFFIGLVFSPLAAACAFIITFEEWKHHYSDNKKPLGHAIQMALFTLIFFLLLSLGAGYFFSKAFTPW